MGGCLTAGGCGAACGPQAERNRATVRPPMKSAALSSGAGIESGIAASLKRQIAAISMHVVGLVPGHMAGTSKEEPLTQPSPRGRGTFMQPSPRGRGIFMQPSPSRRGTLLHELELKRERDRLRSAADPEFGQHAADVELHRGSADDQSLSNLSVRQTFDQ